jgi:uncharacterized protein YbjQ (UPF0145 family)
MTGPAGAPMATPDPDSAGPGSAGPGSAGPGDLWGPGDSSDASGVGDLPEAAARRMGESAFTSGLTVPDFAACLQMGLEPVGYVQGSCVMQWRWYGYAGLGSPFGFYGQWGTSTGQRGGYQQRYSCPHGFVSAEHRLFGQNIEQPWIEDAWRGGFTAACGRMVAEAAALGAHGVVGVADSWHSLSDLGVLEFHVRGTAVRVEGSPVPSGQTAEPGGSERLQVEGSEGHDARGAGEGVWTTYLAGQRLAKLIEAGFAPVAVAAAVAAVRVWASCVTQYQAGGGLAAWGGQASGSEITQVADAHMAVRQLARERVRSLLGSDSLHGASMVTTATEIGEGDADLECILRGNRVRRFKEFDALPRPKPTVRLQ